MAGLCGPAAATVGTKVSTFGEQQDSDSEDCEFGHKDFVKVVQSICGHEEFCYHELTGELAKLPSTGYRLHIDLMGNGKLRHQQRHALVVVNVLEWCVLQMDAEDDPFDRGGVL